MSTKRNLSCALIAALGTCAFADATAMNLQGYAKGGLQRDVPANSGGLLQSFYFDFTDEDHHFGKMSLLQVNNMDPPKVGIEYSDSNGDDRYAYDITLAPFPGELPPFTKRSEICKGSCTIDLEKPQTMANLVFVLRGFDIRYIGGDHHIDQIKIVEQDGQATVALNDQNDDDRFLVILQYAYIPRLRFSVVDERSGSADQGGTQGTDIPGGTAVLRGFDLDFRNSDHHIKELGIVLGCDGRLKTYYSDKNQDDPYKWTVQFAILQDAPRQVAPMQGRPVLEHSRP